MAFSCPPAVSRCVWIGERLNVVSSASPSLPNGVLDVFLEGLLYVLLEPTEQLRDAHCRVWVVTHL